jgi:hypothetical protein
LAWAAELLWSAILFLNVRDDELGTRKKMGGSHTHIFRRTEPARTLLIRYA